MRSKTPIPLTLEEHRELGCELRRTRARLQELSTMVSMVYGPNNRAAFSFVKAAEAMDRLCADLDAQAARDLPGFGTDGFYI
jgi:hypothetical protein